MPLLRNIFLVLIYFLYKTKNYQMSADFSIVKKNILNDNEHYLFIKLGYGIDKREEMFNGF